MTKQVVIDCFPQSVSRYSDTHAIVAIDIIRATTMAITARALGRQCFCAANLDDARRLAAGLQDPIVAGELGGVMPVDFDMNNSPAELLDRSDMDRPLILLSSSGTQLICKAGESAHPTYLACFRNFSATARVLGDRHDKVAVIGAGSRGEFREEDQICCAWIADQLLRAGYTPQDTKTLEVVRRWKDAVPSACMMSNSVAYLRRTQQLKDLDFILRHIDDLNALFCVQGGNEVCMMTTRAAADVTPRRLAA